jgi:glycosyltransferase involved in cell wall biosynthesis
MRVAMFTNTYLPLLGGVERSVATAAAALRDLGHHCLVVAPSAAGAAAEPGTLRLRSVEGLAGTAFSYRLPGSRDLRRRLRGFLPDVVHAHHPFMLGETGVRLARGGGLPVVFTCHTRWERFVPAGWPLLRRLAQRLPVVFANLCDLAIAPTPSIARLLHRRGVAAPIAVVPTGIDVAFFASGSRQRGRSRWGCAADEPVIGHVGRLVREKNVAFVAESALAFLRRSAGRLLLVGEGPLADDVERRFAAAGRGEQLVRTGRLDGEMLADAYAAMDVLAFAARTDTQGLVLAEAAAAGCPIVALDAPGPRDFVDASNGLLLPATATPEAFAAGLAAACDPGAQARLAAGARRCARAYDHLDCTHRLVAAYEEAAARWSSRARSRRRRARFWWRLVAEWELLGQKAALARAALR